MHLCDAIKTFYPDQAEWLDKVKEANKEYVAAFRGLVVAEKMVEDAKQRAVLVVQEPPVVDVQTSVTVYAVGLSKLGMETVHIDKPLKCVCLEATKATDVEYFTNEHDAKVYEVLMRLQKAEREAKEAEAKVSKLSQELCRLKQNGPDAGK